MCIAVFLAVLTACGGGSSSSGAGGGQHSAQELLIEGDSDFVRAVSAAFQALPTDPQERVTKNTIGVRQADANSAGWDLWINMNLEALSRDTAAWRAGIICHESAHHYQMQNGGLPKNEIESESQARAWQVACLEAVGAPASDISYVREFGTSPLAGYSRSRMGHLY